MSATHPALILSRLAHLRLELGALCQASAPRRQLGCFLCLCLGALALQRCLQSKAVGLRLAGGRAALGAALVRVVGLHAFVLGLGVCSPVRLGLPLCSGRRAVLIEQLLHKAGLVSCFRRR